MNAKRIANELQIFDRDIKTIADDTRHLQVVSAKLFDTLEQLNSSWSGSAHSVYEQNVNEDRELMNNILGVLNRFRWDLEDAEKIYKTCEDKVEGTIASIVV